MGVALMSRGLLTWVPGVHRLRRGEDGSGSAAYCYGVWLKHLTLLWRHGLREMPRTVAELRPGRSAGTGIAALLSGVERWIGLDAASAVTPRTNLRLLRELLARFERRAPGPAAGFPAFDLYLGERHFPGEIVTPQHLARALGPKRLDAIEAELAHPRRDDPHARLRYLAMDEADAIADESVDLVFSHVALNEVHDLEATYARFARWLRPGGWMSHQLDFTSHGLTPEWNGHLRYGDKAWKVIAGARPRFLNRETLDGHLRMLDRLGFAPVEVIRGIRRDGLPRDRLAPRWREAFSEDLATHSAFVILRRW